MLKLLRQEVAFLDRGGYGSSGPGNLCAFFSIRPSVPYLTVNTCALAAVPPPLVTLISPLLAPAGTVALT